jgi:ABC-type multidrug transport system ATPase subunit
VVIAKSLIQKPELVIFDEPTRGVDVGAIVEIHRFINELADDGIAVVVISSYLPEVLALSDRILVAREGRIAEEMDISEATESRIMCAAVHRRGSVGHSAGCATEARLRRLASTWPQVFENRRPDSTLAARRR